MEALSMSQEHKNKLGQFKHGVPSDSESPNGVPAL